MATRFRSLLLLSLPALVACGSGEIRTSPDAAPEVAELQLTTTLDAETANNTSASDLFVDRYTPASRFNGSTTPISNGDAPTSSIHRADMKRGAVSKLDVHGLLAGGAATKIFVETQSWFCTKGNSPIPTGAPDDQCGSHIDIGYDANTSAEVAAQLDDMQSRGFDGVIADWEGTSAGRGLLDSHTTSTPAINNGVLFGMLAESEKRGGSFKIAVMEDEGIRACASSSGCDVTQQLLSDLDFLSDQGAYGSSAYYKDSSGRPFVFFFDIDGQVAHYGKSIDWSTVRSGAKGNPVFIFQGGGQFGHAQGGGAFFWAPAPSINSYQDGDPEQLNDLSWFYEKALQNNGKHAFGGLFKGFDDKVVNGWGGGERYIPQLCGKTWLDGFDQVNQKYTASAPLEALQVMTWDDYEEGTELETGIDNHVAVNAAPVQGTTLTWSVGLASDAPSECANAVNAGWNIETTIHHYVVYASPASDGQNLAVVAANVAAGTQQLDLSNKLPAGNYLIYVEAVGQPSIHNQMSAPVSYSVAAPVTATVHISSPTASSVVGSSVHVVASATASVAINQLQVWIDGKKYYEHPGASIDTNVTLPDGAHKLTVVALDNSYAQLTKTTVSFTVSSTVNACGGSPYFCDDYSGTSLAGAYATTNGTWTRATGSYTAMDGVAWQRALAALSADFGDFDVTIRGTGLGDSGLGLAYNFSATSNSYNAVVVHPAQFQGVYLKRINPSASDTDLGHVALPSSLQGQAISLRVVRSGTTITVSLNGQQVLQADDGASAAHGKLALIESTTDATSGAGAAFTLFRVDGSPVSSTQTNAVGPRGGSVNLLRFSMTGDTRPGTDNSTGVSDYPVAIIDQIAAAAKANGSQFMIDMGDHMNNWHNQTTAAQQLDKYKIAMQDFGKAWFMTMGNHECDPSVMSWPLRCVPKGTNGSSGNFLAFLDALNATGVDVVKNGVTVPWYSFDVQTSLGTARFIILADNAWCTEQESWFKAELADADKNAKYTIVVQHHPPYDGSDAKDDVATISDILTTQGHKVSLWLTGHAHAYKRRTDILGGRAVVLGIGGAPLGGAAGTSSSGWSYFYGYGMVEQQSNGDLKVTVYDLNNSPMDSWSVSPN